MVMVGCWRGVSTVDECDSGQPTPKPKAAVEIGNTGRTVASAVRAYRRLRDMTQAQLAERVADAGRPMTASTINKIETVERRVDVDDLVALAVALEVQTTQLLESCGHRSFISVMCCMDCGTVVDDADVFGARTGGVHSG